MQSITRLSFVLFVTLLAGYDCAAADWRQFRGTDGTSVTPSKLPITFGGDQHKNIAWQTELPGRAVNGPIVVGDQVIGTASSGQGQKRLHVFSLNRASGEIEWQRRFWATGRTLCHPLTAVAAPTPASDGEHIFVLFASNDLICLDLNGDVRWMRGLSIEFTSAFDDRGLASSPWLVGNTLVVQVACSGDSFALGIDPATGRNKWKIPLAKTTNWATPCEITLDGQQLVVLQSAERLLLIDPESGDIHHAHSAEGSLIPSPTVAGSTVLMPADGMTALAFAAKQTRVLWQAEKVGAESASPVVSDGVFFVIRRPNLLTAASVADGAVLWKTRLDGNGFWATPLLTADHIYVPNTDGIVQVVTLDEGQVVAENEIGEEILGSPAAADDALYLRTTSSLMKIAEPAAASGT